MTYIITAVTDKSILMGSDSRLNYHNEEIDNSTGERFQVILAIADCIRKTLYLSDINIGIQFIGIGYFPENGQKYPISHFIPEILKGIIETDSITSKFKKIYDNLKRMTIKGNTGQYVNGVMAGYENGIPYITTFNTFIDDFTVNAYEVGTYVESESCNEIRPKDREKSIQYINDRITKISQLRPQDVGGPIEVLEIKPDGNYNWVQENKNIFEGTVEELFKKWNYEPESISGKILNPPIKQKLKI
jgi:hypothetical protein